MVKNINCDIDITGAKGGNPLLMTDLVESPDHNVSKRCDILYNDSDEELSLNRCLSRFGTDGSVKEILYHESSWCNENRPVRSALPEYLHLESSGARTTGEYNPFLRIYYEDSIVTFHIHPIGDWELNLYPSEENRVIVTAGLKSKELELRLLPGEELKLPCITVHEHPSSDEAACNKEFQEFLYNDVRPMEGKAIPLVYNSWFYDFDKFTVDDLKVQALAAKELGAEIFVVDAGWYGPIHDDWSKAAGDWREKTNGAFYGNMKGFSEYIRSLEMGFGLWIEPEKICKGVPVLNEHPDWFIRASDGIYYPDLARSEPRKYLSEIVDGLIGTYCVMWLKFDFNFPLGDDPWKSNHYLYMKGYYELIDGLRYSHPDVIFEACQSGAMRADPESIRHFDTQFLSDTVYPEDIVRIFKNILCRTSPSLLFKWIVLRQVHGIPKYGFPLSEAPGTLIVPAGPTWNDYASCDAMTLCALIYLGNTGLSGDLSGLDEDIAGLFKEHICSYKKYIQGTRTTACLIDTDEPGWTVFMIENEKASFRVSFRERGSSPECGEYHMPVSDFASVEMEVLKN